MSTKAADRILTEVNEGNEERLVDAALARRKRGHGGFQGKLPVPDTIGRASVVFGHDLREPGKGKNGRSDRIRTCDVLLPKHI